KVLPLTTVDDVRGSAAAVHHRQLARQFAANHMPRKAPKGRNARTAGDQHGMLDGVVVDPVSEWPANVGDAADLGLVEQHGRELAAIDAPNRGFNEALTDLMRCRGNAVTAAELG